MRTMMVGAIFSVLVGCGHNSLDHEQSAGLDGTIAVSWSCSTPPGSAVQFKYQVYLYEDPDSNGNDILTTCTVQENGGELKTGVNIWGVGLPGSEGRCLVDVWTARLLEDGRKASVTKSGTYLVIPCTIKYHTGPSGS